VAQRVTKLDLTATPEDVDVRITEMKAAYTEEQFAEQLKLNHMTLDDLKQNLRHSLTQNRLLNREINSKVTVSDTDITNYFNQHRSDFDLIETRYRVAEIVVTSVPRRSLISDERRC
jgi:peptidyl-prolyl cis-trans isomerase SurA